MYGQHYEFIERTLKTESVMDMYDMYQACLSGAVTLEEGGDSHTTNGQRIEEIRFTQDTDKLQRSLEDLLLGEIDVTYKKVIDPTSSPVLINTTDIRIDEESSNIIDMTVLDVDVDGTQIPVVTDYNNKCVKSFFTTNNKASHSKLSLESYPFGITKLNERQVLVSVPYSNKIITIEVSPKLHLISTVNTGKMYRSLAVLNNISMVAGAWFSDSCVDILNMAGQVMKSIVKGDGLHTYPWCICVTSKGNILVSDSGKQTVTCLPSEGNVVWTYITDGQSRGITTFGTGSVLVAVSSKVVHLRETGILSRNIFTSVNSLKNPKGVYYDGIGSLYVSDENHLYEFSFAK